MSTSRSLALASILAGAWAASAVAQEGPHLGVPVSPADIAAWDISIGPSGAGLPAGSGTAATGAGVYNTKCVACHGEKGVGKPSDQLAGGNGTLKDAAPVRTVGSYWPYATTLFDYIRRAMPWPQPQSLSPDEVYSVTAYVLYLNGLVAERDTVTHETLPKVQMPNREGFIR